MAVDNPLLGPLPGSLEAPTPSDAAAGRVASKPKPKPADPAPGVNYGNLSSALGLDKMKGDLAADRADLDYREGKASAPVLTPPPPQNPPTDPFQAFGQPAMWLAAFGGLLSRGHLTSAIQSAGAVMQATHNLDMANAKQNYDQWKVASENAIKTAKFEQDAYKNAIARYRADAGAGEAEIKTLTAAFKNAALEQVYETEGMPGVVKYLGKQGSSTVVMEKRQADLDAELSKYQDRAAAKLTFRQEHPDATPQEITDADLAIDAGRSPDEGKGATANWTPFTDAKTGFNGFMRIEDGKPKYMDLQGNPVEAPSSVAKVGAAPVAGSITADRAAEQADIAKAHPDWSQGQVAAEQDRLDRERAQSVKPKTINQLNAEFVQEQMARGIPEPIARQDLTPPDPNSTMTPAGKAYAVKVYRATGALPPGWTQAAAKTKVEIINEAGRQDAAEHGSATGDISGRATVKADAASLANLTKQSDSLGAYAKSADREFQLALNNLPTTPQPLDSQFLTRWVRNGASEFGNTQVPKYMTYLISGLDEYAKIIGGATGAAASSDSARELALSLLPKGATTAQIQAIIPAIQDGIRAKQEEYEHQREDIQRRLGNFPGASPDNPPVPGARKANDRKWYVPDATRPGKYLEVRPSG